MYVNFISYRPAAVVLPWSDLDYACFGPPRNRTHAFLELAHILIVINKFRPDYDRPGRSFAIRKPGFWSQKDKYEAQDTENVPLPGISGIGPKESLLDYIPNGVHRSKLLD
jgi:hypothetical protein